MSSAPRRVLTSAQLSFIAHNTNSRDRRRPPQVRHIGSVDPDSDCPPAPALALPPSDNRIGRSNAMDTIGSCQPTSATLRAGLRRPHRRSADRGCAPLLGASYDGRRQLRVPLIAYRIDHHFPSRSEGMYPQPTHIDKDVEAATPSGIGTFDRQAPLQIDNPTGRGVGCGQSPKWSRSASSSSARSGPSRVPASAPMRSTSIDRTCSA
jgi:hypothetical protein